MATNDLSSNERDVAAVVQVAMESLGDILKKSGTILYSSSATLRPGKYYFLGLNPGGSDDGTKTIEQSLNTLRTHSENAYLQEDWGSPARRYGIGEHPLQRNYRYLFGELW